MQARRWTTLAIMREPWWRWVNVALFIPVSTVYLVWVIALMVIS
jgi:hypothetical protein